ncbi:NUDIX hydrolase [Peristeroidobacter agariperforans]|uniref:NUDIX hydrolase n=1 Tax=Peristeroidobacter agariperforans TaxID=268404 RepID=UPI00101BF458|nr:NUDIX hydrolase [Peristeroidobacter agariperforans]
MTLRPDLTVAAIVERDGHFLLVEERVGNRMVFNQPAGHVEHGEQFLEAVIRETLEETAWTFRPEALIGVYLWEQVEKQKSFLRVVYSGEVTHHHPDRPLDRGIERALWLDRDQIVARSARLRSPLVLRCIDDYLEGARHPLDVAKNVVKDGVLSPDVRARTLEHPAINRLI